MSGNELEGPIRITHPSLSTFDASGNNLSGTLSSSSFQAPNLSTLILKNNTLSGDLAFLSSSLPLLSMVDLWLNSFSGPLPDISGKARLTHLDLCDNNIEGSLDALFGGSSWNSSLSFPALNVLLLRGNRLSGNLADAFFVRFPRLEYFNVNSNLFSGPLPERLPPTLLFAGFTNNDFCGPIPRGWGERLQNATDILLENNNLTGTIPDFFGDLPRLEVLTLSMNNFSGSVPEGLGRSTSLKKILLDDANLDGELPQGLFSGMTSLANLSMMGNRFTGALPDPFPLGMEKIHLSTNNFSGPVPSSYSSLVSLTDLRLEGNNITGSLPSNVTTLPMLEMLLLSRNHLSGALPGDYSPRLASFSFTGSVPAGLCGAKTVLLSGNRFTSVELGRYEKDCKVETLGLASNSLTEVPTFWPALRVLKMGNNSLTSYSDLFDRMSAAVYLGLANTLAPSTRGTVTFASVFSEVRQIRDLKTLDLTNNSLTGTFRQALFQGVNLPKLRNLLLAGNNITGSIPSALGSRLVGLSFFNVSGNAGLTGTIPDSLSTLSDADVTGTGLYDSRYVPAQGSVQVKYHESMLCSNRFVPDGKTQPLVLADPPFHKFKFCTCLDGFYGVPSLLSGACLPCPTSVNASCVGGNLTAHRVWPVCNATIVTTTLASCPGKGACKETWTTNTSICPSEVENRSKVCSDGHEGRLCTKCKKGFYSSSYGCKPCRARLTVPWWAYFCFGALAQLGLSAWIVHKGERSTRSGLLRTLVLHAQLYASLPSDGGDASDFMFNFGLEGAECAGLDPFWSPFLFAVFLPLVALVAGPVLALAVSRGRYVRPAFKADASLGVLAVWLLLSFGSLRRSLAPLNGTAYGSDDRTKYLTAFMWRPYSTTDPSFALAILSACWVPLLTAFAFFKAEGPSKVYLEAPYREGLQKWEAVQVTRRLVVAYLQGLSPYESKALPVGLTVTLTVSLAAHCWLRPFRSRLDNAAEALSLCILQGTYVVTLVTPDFRDAHILLLVVNSVFLVALGITVVFKKGSAAVKRVSQRLSKGDAEMNEKGQPLLPCSREL